ncbi:DUF1795 domain-containing protein [Pectobacterium parmentieri]|uniref:DUF1795 domain-containing protein n=1 Tax=Pectobacterium parmentieri TaxID=1905730 RepID=A0A8B3FHJ6_PECPM|nr:DcrB-related protein [Pectobacterium parmentieri]ACX86199.1 Domain of unknown function DUF1795 [Pectobacterium parmentieri WPP163]AOR60509.1 hypothetical protein A8F97_16645 [Pectobacterium parmentieri]AYG99803.1 DUF1795 domain-containing protein [Pectobacterium parmentieri]AYH04253.1 DUF1795 domain-containing protein [Pectobacterium parmentieri]AYH08556.1 DUF1795 domain-containing protein [Pectobacterium parmentieri]
MTTPSASYCRFTEGGITLPDGYQDRTLNAFTPCQEGEPALTISRDRLNDGEALGDYIDRQLALMTQHLKGWKTQSRDAIWLGDRLLEGERIQASYLRDGQRLWQQQAVFALANAQILVFTLSKTTTLSTADGSRFNALLGSFTFNQ